VLFESHGLLDRDLSRKQLAPGMARLVQAAKDLSASKRDGSEDTQDSGSSG
jgi:hypothetical protein